jgi:hypothetical protein
MVIINDTSQQIKFSFQEKSCGQSLTRNRNFSRCGVTLIVTILCVLLTNSTISNVPSTKITLFQCATYIFSKL